MLQLAVCSCDHCVCSGYHLLPLTQAPCVVYSQYQSWFDAPTANTCDATATPHQQCLLDPLTTVDGAQKYSPLCDDDCQLLCDGHDPTILDPSCPIMVGNMAYTGRCQTVRMASGLLKKVCT